MTTTPQKELRNNVGNVLRRAETGAEFTVTVSGRPVAQLGPVRARTWILAAQLSDFWDLPGDPELAEDRFHDLRHTFGTRMIAKADIRRVQEWMGHADIQTTMRYLHYAPRADDARLVAVAFALPAHDKAQCGVRSGSAAACVAGRLAEM